MQTEPMNVDTKDLSCAEALELAIAETRLALEEYADLIDERPVDDMSFLIERSHNVVVAGLDRCKAAADGLAAYSRVLEMANNAAGERLRNHKEALDYHRQAFSDCKAAYEILKSQSTNPQEDLLTDQPGQSICWPCLGWMALATILGMGIEFANGFLARASGWLM